MELHGVLAFINNYGYAAVFILVFLQEIGIPNPVPNELVLLFAGALSTIGDLNFFLIFLTAVAADVIGSSILYFAFYFFEHWILERLSKWTAINKNLDKMKERILKQGLWAIFLGRMIPFVRGYVSTAAGVLNIPYKVFLPIVATSAAIWSGGYVILGHYLGKNWEVVGRIIGAYLWPVAGGLIAVVIAVFLLRSWRKRRRAGMIGK